MSAAVATARAYAGDPEEHLTAGERETYDALASGVPADRASLAAALGTTSGAAAKRLSALRVKLGGRLPGEPGSGPVTPITYVEGYLGQLDARIEYHRSQIAELEATRLPVRAMRDAYQAALPQDEEEAA